MRRNRPSGEKKQTPPAIQNSLYAPYNQDIDERCRNPSRFLIKNLSHVKKTCFSIRFSFISPEKMRPALPVCFPDRQFDRTLLMAT